jgi:hypothetical protein
LSKYFLDAVVIKIGNSHDATEASTAPSGCSRRARLASTCLTRGTASIAHTRRLYKTLDLQWCVIGRLVQERPVLILLLFIPAIDDLIIPNLELRAAILSALEAASVLVLLLRAEALTAAGRVALYAASRRFLEALKSPVFLD